MPTNGTGYADKAQAEIERRLRKIYQDAQKELIEKLDKHTKRLSAMDKVKRQQLADGKITQAQYNNWLRGQMFTGQQWKNKVDSLSETMLHANEQANAIIEGKRRAVFGKNYLYQAKKIGNDLNMGISFDLYDSSTVTRLLRDQPELLPRRKVDKEKDFAWNRENIANAVTQGIIQGDSIPALARRIAEKTAFHNRKVTERYARTAMTGAQNAGRMEMLHEAQAMGIGVKKVWLATLDSRTRDAHAKLDGQEAEVDEPFKSELGDIMFPGDPTADPANTWNCRCTLIYKYDNYAMQNATRYDQENNEFIDYNSSENINERAEFKEMTEDEYKTWQKENSTREKLKNDYEQKFKEEYGIYPDEVDTSDPFIEIDGEYIDLEEERDKLWAKMGGGDLHQVSNGYGRCGYIQSADGSKAINAYLRRGEIDLYSEREMKKTIDAMNRLIDASTLSENLVVDRCAGIDAIERMGINIGQHGKSFRIGHCFCTEGLNVEEIVDKINDGFIGTVLEDKGFMSASATPTLNIFGGSDVTFTISAKKGTHAFISDNTSEAELVFKPNTKQRITGAKVLERTAYDYEGKGIKRKVVEIFLEFVE